jgi:hypothetical protein
MTGGWLSHAAVVVAAVCGIASASDVILRPTAPAGQQQVGLIYCAGEGLSAEQYQPIAQAMQQEAAAYNLSLWVGIPDFPLDTPPIDFADNVDRAYASMQAAGMPAGTKMMGAAHSLGGVFLQMYHTQQLSEVAGRSGEITDEHRRRFEAAAGNVNFQAIILMGSFITRPNTPTWKTPTMHIAGELDGLARITRMAQAVVTQFEAHGGLSSPAAVRDWPVGVIDGGAHMSFASGVPPALVKARDLKPEVGEQVAHRKIAGVSAAFIAAQLTEVPPTVAAGAVSQLRAWIDTSYRKYWSPLLEAFEEEGLYALAPACNCNNPQKEPFDLDKFFGGWINYYPCLEGTTTPDCRHGSPWAGKMQVKLAGLEQYGINVNVQSAFHPVSQTKPETNLPYVFEQYTTPTKGNNLTVTVVTENIYHSDPLDTGFYPQAAIEMRAKQVSRQRMMLHAGFQHVKVNDTDAMDLNRCAELNSEALKWALAKAAPHTATRFQSKGEQVEFGNDINGEGGPLWIDQKLKQERITGASGVSRNRISSIAGVLETPFIVKSIAGTHYCKLWSPAAALEWLLVDGLRLNNAL